MSIIRVGLLFLVATLVQQQVPASAQWPYSSRNSSGSSSSSTFGGTTLGGSSFSGSTVLGRPIGTATSDSPRYYGPPGQVFYYNNAGAGYYRANPLAPQYATFPAPISLGGNYFQLGGLTGRMGYWRASSGYYYPWCPPVYMTTVTYPPAPAVYAITDGLLAPTQPPVGSIIADMRQFIDDAKNKKQLDQSNYESIFNRLNQITAQSSELAARNGGLLTVSDEREIRKQLDLLSADLARALVP